MTIYDTLNSVFFLYSYQVNNMIIYIDLIFIINLLFDFSLLLTVDLLLKRNTKIFRIAFGSLIGELSMLTLFISFNSLVLNLFKALLSLLMAVVSFSYKNFKYTFYNVIYLYLVGIILGGFEYYLYNEFKIDGTYSLKFLIIIILSPIVLIIYYKSMKKFKKVYNNHHKLKIIYDGNIFEGIGFLDSGNKLVCPISGKPIVLIEKEYIVHKKLKLYPVPYNALNYHGLLYCFTPESVYIDNVLYKNVLIGLSEVKFNIDGCNALLNARLENI